MMEADGRPHQAFATTIGFRRMLDFLTRPDTTASPSLADMIALWERLLNFAPVGADDDFFDLGGDSLQALTLFHEIERATGRLLPITSIYEAATPSRLVDLLDRPAAPQFSPLVLLKPGAGEPLFIAHGIGGNVIELKKLGESIASSRPVYAIQAKGVDGSEEPFDNVADMVACYLSHVRARQPRGPYFLAGYSFGGIVAMEMARQLKADGETVALLAFIDSFGHPQSFPQSARRRVRLGCALHAFRTMPFGAACGLVLARARGRGGNALRPELILANFPANGVTAALRRVHNGGVVALTNYRPQYYSGEVLFFQPETSIFPIAPKRIWGKLLGGLAVHNVRGDHGSMVHEHVADLAAALSRALRGTAGAA
jgi:acetoacetyl-CoA synthetase